MKKIFISLLFIGLVGTGFVYKDTIIDKTEYLITDPAEIALHANTSQSDTVEKFESEIYGKIHLLVGKEETFGFRHILARHTTQYFVDFENKNGASMFDSDLEAEDILIGIKHFLEHCVEVQAYNSSNERNIAYVGFAKFNDEYVKCLLIVREEDKGIVTFYPFTREREQEMVQGIRTQMQFQFD